MDDNEGIVDVEFQDYENESYVSAPQIAQKIGDTDIRVRHWAEPYVFGNLIGIEKVNGRKKYKESDIYKFAFIKELADKNYTHKQIGEYISKNGFEYAEYNGGLVNTKDPLGFQALASALSLEVSAKLNEFTQEIMKNVSNQLSEHLARQYELNVEMKAGLESSVDEIINSKLSEITKYQENIQNSITTTLDSAIDKMQTQSKEHDIEIVNLLKQHMEERKETQTNEQLEYEQQSKSFWKKLFK